MLLEYFEITLNMLFDVVDTFQDIKASSYSQKLIK